MAGAIARDSGVEYHDLDLPTHNRERNKKLNLKKPDFHIHLEKLNIFKYHTVNEICFYRPEIDLKVDVSRMGFKKAL